MKSPKRLRNPLPGKPEFAEVRLTSTESPDSRLSPQALRNHNQHMRMSHKQRPPNANRLSAAALAGLVTATPLWIPAGVLIGAAAVLLGAPQNDECEPTCRNLRWASGVDARDLRRGET